MSPHGAAIPVANRGETAAPGMRGSVLGVRHRVSCDPDPSRRNSRARATLDTISMVWEVSPAQTSSEIGTLDGSACLESPTCSRAAQRTIYSPIVICYIGVMVVDDWRMWRRCGAHVALCAMSTFMLACREAANGSLPSQSSSSIANSNNYPKDDSASNHDAGAHDAGALDDGAPDAPPELPSATTPSESSSPEPEMEIGTHIRALLSNAYGVIIAKCIAKHSRFSGTSTEPEDIVTDVHIEPSEVLTGSSASIVTIPGGTVGTLQFDVPHASRFRVDSEYLIVLVESAEGIVRSGYAGHLRRLDSEVFFYFRGDYVPVHLVTEQIPGGAR